MWVTVPLVSSSTDPKVQDFVGRVRATTAADTPISHYVLTHYNALMATRAALEKTGTPDREALVDGLAGLTIDSPTGPVAIGKADHHVSLSMFLAHTQGVGLETVQSLGQLAPEAGCA
jgi:branched-chain amino acid transport system substrate-binding protein/urea transport system substrate-binding protein